MKDQELNRLIELYANYKQTNDYAERVAQFAVAEVYREIIVETLKNDPFLNQHLTGLIQMFKYGCYQNNFDKYLEQNVSDLARRKEIAKKELKIDQTGYAGAGLQAVKGLNEAQLTIVKTFLSSALSVNTIDQAIELCEKFDAENIPKVKSGVYSPWLYYINPSIFPILNNSHSDFRKWIDMEADYPSCIRDFNILKDLVGEDELGGIDKFAYNLNNYAELPTGIKVLNLNGNKLFKHSHGIFKKIKKNRENGLPEIFEKNNWIVIGKDTGKNQAANFIDSAEVGDYVYVCYGGDELCCVAKITSEAKLLDKQYQELIKDKFECLYREIEPLYFPIESSTINLKNEKSGYMPSGNSTFVEVPKDSLDHINILLFTPNCNLKIVDQTITSTKNTATKTKSLISESINTTAINSILYGPPGTGKTYSTVDEALKILNIDTSSLTRTEAKQQFAELQKNKRVFFTTFHQNMAYEDFMEGIKPVDPEDDDEFLKYHIQDGLFMQACVEAAFNYIDSNSEQEDIVQELLDFNGLFDKLFDRISDAGSEELETKSGGTVTATVTSQGNLSIKHTGRDKPYTVSRDRLGRIYELYPEPDEIANIQNAFRNAIGGCNATAYWGALNAIAEIRDTEGGETVKPTASSIELAYLDKRKIVQKYWNKNEYSVQTIDKSSPFVFIIDEINRGNVAQIFGELITLIEEDKRMGKPESISAQLPYSKNYFSVPPNLHILGTMNTADRSVEALDTALRRRFSFVQMLPIPEKLKVTSDGIDLSKVLSVLNKRLEILKDCDHMIGHAWFWDVTTIDQLRMVFANKILPLLQEYFYNDYEKLGLVLGDAFFNSLEQVDSNMFASFSGGNGLAGQYDQSWVYQLKPVKDLTVDIFKTLEHLNHQSNLDEEQ